jgi:hypothetical protein
MLQIDCEAIVVLEVVYPILSGPYFWESHKLMS